MPSWTVPMKRTGLVHDANRDPRAPHALVGELLETCAARGHERVLGRDEEAVREHDQERPRAICERNRHAPFSGARRYWAAVVVQEARAQYRRAASASARGRESCVDQDEHMFYPPGCGCEYREEPCRAALNRVRGMPFAWSLNPYMGCVHRCTFCYVRAFEQRADRPSGGRATGLDPRQGERRRSAARGARARSPGAASRWPSEPRPTRTSRRKGATG